MGNLFDENAKTFFKAVLALESEDECERFFSDICTVKEIKDISSRLEVAILLKGGMVYSDIAEKTGASTATISRVNRSLNYGEGGYKAIIERIGDKK